MYTQLVEPQNKPLGELSSSIKRTLMPSSAEPIADSEPVSRGAKVRFEEICGTLGPHTGAQQKGGVMLVHEDAEVPSQDSRSQRRTVTAGNRSLSLSASTKALQLKLVQDARREGMPVREFLTSGRAFELYNAERGTAEKEKANAPDVETIVKDKETGVHEVTPRGSTLSILRTTISPKTPRRPVSSSGTPATPVASPHSSPRRLRILASSPTSASSSASNSPVKLPICAQPCTVTTAMGVATFQTPETCARYMHSMKLLEESQKKKLAKKEKSKRKQGH